MNADGIGATTDDVLELVSRDFPDDRQADALELLEYCDDLPEATRLKVAVVQLAEGDLDHIADYIDAAEVDYRDVLYWAFYPEAKSAR